MENECCSLIRTADQKQLNGDSTEQKTNNSGMRKKLYKHRLQAVRGFEVLDSLRKELVLCDVTLETDDGTVINAHKVILASATPYFQTMFMNFKEGKEKCVTLRELDSTALKLLVDFIYTNQIIVTEENVQNLFHAANLLQLQFVVKACCDFFKTQLDPTNCLGFKNLVSLYGFVELSSSFESYIQQNFSEVVEGDEFICLPYEQVVELISYNALKVPSEEKVFECVVNWMSHNSDYGKDVLLKLMEHVRLPSTAKEYLLNRVIEEPLHKISGKCKDIIIEALKFYVLMNEPSNIIPNTICIKPRQPVDSNKIILVAGCRNMDESCSYIFYSEWYDSVTNSWQWGSKMDSPILHLDLNLDIMHYGFDLFLLEFYYKTCNDVQELDLFSLSLSPFLDDLKSKIKHLSEPVVGVIENCVYVFGGKTLDFELHDGEVFNFDTQERKVISKMCTSRYGPGVGVLNNHLYAVGGFSFSHDVLRSVERYCPTSNTWTPVAEMHIRRTQVGVGVIDGVMYAIGGRNDYNSYRSVEVYHPRSNVWTRVSDMHQKRISPSVVSLDGLLYVIGGVMESKSSVEMYNPKTNIWTELPGLSHGFLNILGAIVIDKPSTFNY